MEIRRMTMEDYDAVYALWKSCKGMGLNDKDDSREGIDRFLKRNPDTNFTAWDGDTLVGVIMGGSDGRRGMIYHTSVREEYRRQGIGEALVEKLLEAYREIGINKTMLVVFERNKAGNAFWEKMGFTVRTDIVYRNKALTELVRFDT